MKKIYINIFDLTIYLYTGKGEIEKYIKKSKSMGYKSHASGMGEVSGFVMWIRDKGNLPIFVHEISHLVDNTLKYYNLKGGEIRAFLTEFLYIKMINKKQKKG